MSNIEEVTSDTFKERVLESEIPVLVDFWAPWCGPCRMMEPVVEEIASELSEVMRVVKLNTDENINVAVDYEVKSIPALLLFYKGGLVHRYAGFRPKAQLMELLNSSKVIEVNLG